MKITLLISLTNNSRFLLAVVNRKQRYKAMKAFDAIMQYTSLSEDMISRTFVFCVLPYHRSNNMSICIEYTVKTKVYNPCIYMVFCRNFPEVILGQREELKALVIAGESFERAAQAGEGHVVGRSS